MKNNSPIKLLLVAFILLSLFQFSTMIPTSYVEQKAVEISKNYASQFPLSERNRIEENYYLNYLDSISEEIIFSIPGVGAYSYSDLKDRQLQLGLDLKGGMRFIIGFDEKEEKIEKLNVKPNELLEQTKLILDQRLNHLGLGQASVTIDDDRKQLHVEVPVGVSPERLRSLIMQEAKLEFWNTYRVTDPSIIEALIKADKVL